MDLTPYVNNLRRELAVAAEAGGDDARALADRLTAPLESAVRLTLLSALSDAAGEITRELAPGYVDVRLRGVDPSFRVTLPPEEHPAEVQAAPLPVIADDDGTTSRINLRLPESLKTRIEEAAARESLSVNTWLVRAASAALEAPEPRSTRRMSTGGQRYTGWVK
ncbi:toxin-antitoxin system HicB family antitoxin [Antrihabitans cavernicola]|uniref:Toxin-antitoxin system HicB family antitoxin n=1 Tax=Antrihabitans cavernicola TaxID=2495913 RepID=A0A5A7SH49_9NOCA|nr:toxin-antitoxin system HicB family antitoxin [Spelaeibacter cavernicola]KAA0024719.1 toxin-antitoxin system HicB family antitoxin [Spelaeibacter cavernicola]